MHGNSGLKRMKGRKKGGTRLLLRCLYLAFFFFYHVDAIAVVIANTSNSSRLQHLERSIYKVL